MYPAFKAARINSSSRNEDKCGFQEILPTPDNFPVRVTPCSPLDISYLIQPSTLLTICAYAAYWALTCFALFESSFISSLKPIIYLLFCSLVFYAVDLKSTATPLSRFLTLQIWNRCKNCCSPLPIISPCLTMFFTPNITTITSD